MHLRLIGAVLALVCAGTAAEARKLPRHESQEAHGCVWDNSGRVTCRGPEKRVSESRKASAHGRGNPGHDPRPRAWCGYWLRHQLGVSDRAYNLARRWARYGTNAHGPAVGTIVVFPHHVGLVTGRTAKGWIVKSGNDGNRVRERVRSLRGAIAFRWPSRVATND